MLGGASDRVGLAHVRRERRYGAEHARGIRGGERRDVVERAHRFVPPGFSASSISITGMPSRIGYR